MFNDDEKRLRYCLTFDSDKVDDVFVRTEAIDYIRSEFLKYWLEFDKLNDTNFYEAIVKLYLDDKPKSYVEIADEICYTVRTLKRYREKFVTKSNELIEKCRMMLGETVNPYKPLS